jgi:TolA-binding protein
MGLSLQALPVLRIDALSVRRKRGQLLAMVAHRQTMPARRPWNSWALAAVTAVVTAILAVGHIAQRAPLTKHVDGARVDPMTIESRGATWSRTDDGSFTRLRLEEGELRIHVDHSGAPRGLRVLVPDGEIEDRGTTFFVKVAGTRTVRVGVAEGSVALRLEGQPARILTAGEQWDATATELAPEPTSATPPMPSGRNVPAVPVRAPSAKHGRSDAAPSEFRDAAGRFESGDSPGAVVALRAFLARHPQDERAEDASYLLVLALRQTGDTSGSERAARAYLERYPAGFRRSEVEVLARSAEP